MAYIQIVAKVQRDLHKKVRVGCKRREGYILNIMLPKNLNLLNLVNIKN
ncbi:MAG: hypothetical protein ACK5NF_06785 [Bacilli bacterium]